MMRWTALLVAVVWTWSGCDDTIDVGAAADCGPRAPEVQAAGPEPAEQPPIAEPDALATYLLDAELAVAPLARQVRAGEAEDAARARYASIAADVASVARVDGAAAFPAEAPDVAAAHFGLVLVAIATHETGLLLALDGDSMPCPMHLGGCDGGWAHSLWEVHARAGRDRMFYLRLASTIASSSLHETGGLCFYTGSCGRSTATRDIEAIYRARWVLSPWRSK